MKDLVNSFNNQKIICDGNKRYLILPLTDHCPPTKPLLVNQAVEAICEQIDWRDIDLVVGEEEKGGFIAVAVALKTNLPFCLAKQNPIHIPGEIGIKFAMGYNQEMTIYINGVKKGARVVVIDDMVDSGGTLIAMIKALRKARVEIREVIALAERKEKNGIERIKNETGIMVKTLIKVDTSGKFSRVLD